MTQHTCAVLPGVHVATSGTDMGNAGPGACDEGNMGITMKISMHENSLFYTCFIDCDMYLS